MTISLITKYPGQVDTSDPTGYPLGKARNRANPADATGTPYEQDLVNDLHGAHQAILAAASVTASGNPDKVGASDVLTALLAIFGEKLTQGTGSSVTFSGLSSISTAAHMEASYIRIGNRIIAFHTASWTSTVTGAKSFVCTLPVAKTSNFVGTSDLKGLINTPSGGGRLSAIGGGKTFAGNFYDTRSSGSADNTLIYTYTVD